MSLTAIDAMLTPLALCPQMQLCDDTFEEHVIPYPPHLTGLHLHGLSPLTPAFDSLPPAEVAAFARDWGFIETRFVELATVPEVRDYVRAVEHKGEWDGERVEGFVVRCTVASVADKPSSVVEAARPPYPAGSPFFFKVKFSQPYLLYRAFREITKSLLPIVDQPSRAWAGTPWTGADRSAANAKKGFVMTPELKAEQERKRNERDEMKARKARGEVVESGKAKAKKERASTHMSPAPAAAAQPNASTSTSVPSVSKDPVKVPPSQIRYPECTPYIFFVRRTMVTNPEWYTQFAQGKGIIHVREEFLRWLETEEGAAMLAEEKAKSRWRRGEKSTLPGVPSGQPVEGSWGKTLLIPVAIPGCGAFSRLGTSLVMAETDLSDLLLTSQAKRLSVLRFKPSLALATSRATMLRPRRRRLNLIATSIRRSESTTSCTPTGTCLLHHLDLPSASDLMQLRRPPQQQSPCPTSRGAREDGDSRFQGLATSADRPQFCALASTPALAAAHASPALFGAHIGPGRAASDASRADWQCPPARGHPLALLRDGRAAGAGRVR